MTDLDFGLNQDGKYDLSKMRIE